MCVWPFFGHNILLMSIRKFGKQIQKRQLEVPEYAASFVNYKALKKVCSIASFDCRPLASRPSLRRIRDRHDNAATLVFPQMPVAITKTTADAREDSDVV